MLTGSPWPTSAEQAASIPTDQRTLYRSQRGPLARITATIRDRCERSTLIERSHAIQRYLVAVPKAELLVHLEGSIRPQTLLELARRNKVALPASNLEELQAWFTFRDFEHFIQLYASASICLKTAEDYELIVYEFGAEMARQYV